ncbi:MAG TPA: glycosyltransferase [Candidatus Omnitrophota bacterium]|nr:glycosyltransferase [Candidatus Omnitrophota bacterium]
MDTQTHNKVRIDFEAVDLSREEFIRKNEYYHRHLRNYVRFLIPSQANVLEIGCHTGEQLAALDPKRGVGIDFSQHTVELAKKKFPFLDFHVGQIDQLSINETFDYVLINNIIGYADDLQAAFDQIHTVCRPETKVILIYHSHLWRPVLKLAEILGLRMKWPEQHWLSTKDLKNLLQLSDFRVVTITHHFLFPIYIPFLSTLFNKYIVHLPFFRSLAFNHILIFQPIGTRKDPAKVSCSVVIPCRNEKGNIEQAVARTPAMGAKTEFIFVEGHSKDGTYEECLRVQQKYRDKNIKVLVQKGKGKGDAVREGFALAKGDVLMILDADLTTAPEDMPKFFDALVKGKGEFINGSRLVYRMESQAMRFLNMIANRLFSNALTYLLGQYLKDTLCGTKVLWRQDYEKIAANRSYFGDFDPFGDFDLLFGAAKLHLRIIEIPVQYKARTYGTSQISRFQHGWLLIKMTFFAMRKIRFI